MLKKTITYIDYNGNERTEDYYFNLTEVEAMELELSASGGLTANIQKIVDSQDGAAIFRIFKEIILKAYGEKSLDGKRFIKSKELSEAFSQTGAYNKFFMELVTDADAAAAFINGITPDEAKTELKKESGK